MTSIKLLVGIIATDSNDYEISAQNNIWKTYMNIHPNVRSFFLKFATTTTTSITTTNDTFYCPVPSQAQENNNISVLKTLEFMKYMLQYDDSWDYMLRTNLSSLFHWDRVISLISQNTRFDVIANNVLPPYPNAWPVPVIPSGCGMFLSRKAVRSVVDEWYKDPVLSLYIHPEDVTIGILLGRAGYDTIVNYHYEVVLPYMEPNDRFFHLRTKMFDDTKDRVDHEIPMMKKWIQYWYSRR